ncbi:MAG: CNNM domain-containing protein [Verrucomicrobiota bacterium]
MNEAWLIVVILLSLGLSFLCSGMEAGVFALSRLRIRQQMRAGKPAARLLHGYLEDSEGFLWTILAGNSVANFNVGALLVLGLHHLFKDQPALFVAALVVSVFLFYTFCDLLPKTLFQQFPNRLCLAMVQPFRFVYVGLSPVVTVMKAISDDLLKWTGGREFRGHLFGNRDELRLVMQESGQTLTSEEKAMINRVMDLQHLTVRQVMAPLAQVVVLDKGAHVGEALQLAREKGLTRFPVSESEGEARRIRGVVSVRALLFQDGVREEHTVGQYLQPALYLDGETRLEVALQRIQRTGNRLAIVTARDGREIGIVTIQDILKVVVGEMTL